MVIQVHHCGYVRSLLMPVRAAQRPRELHLDKKVSAGHSDDQSGPSLWLPHALLASVQQPGELHLDKKSLPCGALSCARALRHPAIHMLLTHGTLPGTALH